MTAFGLLDCNNFYASVERVFNAGLHNRPVVVVTGGAEGIIIARSQEAKDLGIGMAVPVFQVRDIIEKNNVVIRAANFELYGDMSARVMGLLEEFSPDIQIYSIDEAFFLVSDSVPLKKFGEDICTRIKKYTGLPVSVGFARTKTLAKLANYLGKKSRTVVDLYNAPEAEIERLLAETPVGEIWGIGPGTAKKLTRRGITTALALRDMDLTWTHKALSIVGARIVLELRGTRCYSLRHTPDELAGRKTITCSRSFGKAVALRPEIRQAISMFVTRAAERMRGLGFAATRLTVSVNTDRFKDTEDFYARHAAYTSYSPSDATPELIEWAMKCLDRVYQPGRGYKKAGVTLGDLVPFKKANARLLDEEVCQRTHHLMTIVDKMNRRWGHDTVRYAGMAEKHQAKKSEPMYSDIPNPNRSESYTTRLEEVLKIGDL